jgi:hypothetical protein
MPLKYEGIWSWRLGNMCGWICPKY